MPFDSRRTRGVRGADYAGYHTPPSGKEQHSSDRWPLLRATDKVLAQARWQRREDDMDLRATEAMLPALDGTVAQLDDARGGSTAQQRDWYLAPKVRKTS